MGPSTLERGCSRTRTLCRTIEPANKKGRRKQKKEKLQEDARCLFFLHGPASAASLNREKQAAKVLKNKFPCQGHSAATVTLAAARLVAASRPVSTLLLLPAALTTATSLSTAWPRRPAACMVATRVDDDLLKIEKNVDQKSTEKLKQIYAPAGGAKLHPSPKRFKSSQDPELQRQRSSEHSAKIQRRATSRVENAA